MSLPRGWWALPAILGAALLLWPVPQVDYDDLRGQRVLRRKKPVVILMIGDGMGRGPLDAASCYRSGRPGSLSMHGLPNRGQLTTDGLQGVMDSAAAATAMSTGRLTRNKSVGVDPSGRPLTVLADTARRRGLALGIVTTAILPHATPGAFTAHAPYREAFVEIANQLAVLKPEVMLGGGWKYFAGAAVKGSVRDDGGLLEPLMESGYTLVGTLGGLKQAVARRPDRLLGLFSAFHMPYVTDEKRYTSRIPSLTEMAMAAIAVLNRDADGFFLVVEGARIDMAGHSNRVDRSIGETLAFDAAVDAVSRWAEPRENVVLIVAADHDTGGMVLHRCFGDRRLPRVSWESKSHYPGEVSVFARGPRTAVFDGTVRDHRWIHAVALSHIEATPLDAPEPFEDALAMVAGELRAAATPLER